jgi:hypothetical protein
MRSKFLAGLAAFVTVASALSASSADAQTVQTPSASSGDNAVGFLVRYRAGVDPIAPNGQPTGENFAGVDLENSRNLGGQLYAVEFARDLSDEQATEALQNLKTDPRVEKVEFDRFVFMQGLKQEPLAPPSQLCKARAEKLGGVYVRKACMASIQATDSWLAGNTPRVTIQWSKPTTKYSGSIIGYRLQVYVSGVWKTLKEQTTSTARSYTTTSKYLKAGVENYFRIAAIARYSGRNYLGYYKLTSVTPTAAPKTLH